MFGVKLSAGLEPVSLFIYSRLPKLVYETSNLITRGLLRIYLYCELEKAFTGSEQHFRNATWQEKLDAIYYYTARTKQHFSYPTFFMSFDPLL